MHHNPNSDGETFSSNQSKFKIEQIENNLMFLERSINLQINQSVISYENSKESLKVASENLELAREVYFASEKKYSQGVGSNLEIIDANNSLKISQNQYYNSPVSYTHLTLPTNREV